MPGLEDATEMRHVAKAPCQELICVPNACACGAGNLGARQITVAQSRFNHGLQTQSSGGNIQTVPPSLWTLIDIAGGVHENFAGFFH
jgi:hypothetical protein